MARSLSETGKAVGLVIHALGRKREKFVPATITNQVDDLSPQNCSNRLKHFKDLGFVNKGFDGLYYVPEEKLDSLWDYLSSTGQLREKTQKNYTALPESYVVDGLDLRVFAEVAHHKGEQFNELFLQMLATHHGILNALEDKFKPTEWEELVKDPNKRVPFEKATKKMIEWMQ